VKQLFKVNEPNISPVVEVNRCLRCVCALISGPPLVNSTTLAVSSQGHLPNHIRILKVHSFKLLRLSTTSSGFFNNLPLKQDVDLERREALSNHQP